MLFPFVLIAYVEGDRVGLSERGLLCGTQQ